MTNTQTSEEREMNTIPFHADCIGAEDFVDRGPLTQPAELTEADWIAADLAEDANKSKRRADMELARAKEAQINTPDLWRGAGWL
jgi:hypothetical protein